MVGTLWCLERRVHPLIPTTGLFFRRGLSARGASSGPLLARAGSLWSGSVVGGVVLALCSLSCGGCHLLLCDRLLVAAATSACVRGGCHLRPVRTTSTGLQAVVSCALLSRVQVRLARTTCRGYQVRRRSSTTQAGTGAAQARRTTSWRPQVAFRSDAFSCVSLSRAQVR